MEIKRRNKPTNYGISVTVRTNIETVEQFKEVCARRGLKYNEVIRDLINQFLRANN